MQVADRRPPNSGVTSIDRAGSQRPLRPDIATLDRCGGAHHNHVCGLESIGALRSSILRHLGIRTWHHGDDDRFNSGRRICTDEACSARPLVQPEINHSYDWHDSRQYNDWRQSRPTWPSDRRMAEPTQHKGTPRAWRQQMGSNASNFPGRDGQCANTQYQRNIGQRDCVSAGHDDRLNHIGHRTDGSRVISDLGSVFDRWRHGIRYCRRCLAINGQPAPPPPRPVGGRSSLGHERYQLISSRCGSGSKSLKSRDGLPKRNPCT